MFKEDYGNDGIFQLAFIGVAFWQNNLRSHEISAYAAYSWKLAHTHTFFSLVFSARFLKNIKMHKSLKEVGNKKCHLRTFWKVIEPLKIPI